MPEVVQSSWNITIIQDSPQDDMSWSKVYTNRKTGNYDMIY